MLIFYQCKVLTTGDVYLFDRIDTIVRSLHMTYSRTEIDPPELIYLGGNRWGAYMRDGSKLLEVTKHTQLSILTEATHF